MSPTIMSSPTARCDVLVLGSSLGGLVAANYLARAGLRVLLLEEETKRRALVREPLLLSGLQAGGRILRVLQELALPLIERRQVEREGVALQVILPDTWVDVPRGRVALARELATQELADGRAVRSWLETVDRLGAKAQAQLWETPAARRGRSAAERLVQRGTPLVILEGELPAPPAGLETFVAAQLALLGHSQLAPQGPSAALLLHSAREGGFRTPHAGFSFRELFLRRLPTLHGETLALSSFRPLLSRSEVGIELPRGKLLARALVLAAPREPLRRFLGEVEEPPAWLPPAPPPLELPVRLFRVESHSLPVGMAARVIRADLGGPENWHWLVRQRDPEDPEIEWIVAGGPGASKLSSDEPLGALAPFSRQTILPIDPGPVPRWDLEANELRFAAATAPVLRSRPPIVQVGPELAPDWGFEGEVLYARRVALWLGERLGRRRRMP